MKHLRVYVIVLLLVIMATGCTSRLVGIDDLGDVGEYEKNDKSSSLWVGLTVQERPGDPSPSMNIPFRELKLIAFNVKLVNNSDYQLIIDRQQIALITTYNRMYLPLSKKDVIAKTTRRIKLFRSFFYRNIAYGYNAFTLDEQIILNPGEERTGYLFYRVKSKNHDLASKGEIRLLFSRVKVVDVNELRLKKGHSK